MNDTPKFEVIDRRKYKAEEEERESAQQPAQPASPAQAPEPESEAASSPAAGPRLVTPESHEPEESHEIETDEFAGEPQMPPPPTAEESREQKFAYDASSQRLEDLIRAQNPGAGALPPVTFEHLVQQLFLSSMIQMGGTQGEGQRRVDIIGARQTIDLLGILAEKTKGNLTETEDRMLQTALFEARMAFLELTNMITLQGVPAPPPPKK
ncbi:MAG TPA: DUF1844 domain-containing protein [Terracidiphilus sp.]|jgi:hypothetical protein|nr:DUF1844 domain-containing protein [Terracidiphilus sp.]